MPVLSVPQSQPSCSLSSPGTRKPRLERRSLRVLASLSLSSPSSTWTETGGKERAVYSRSQADVALPLKLPCPPGSGRRFGRAGSWKACPVEAGPGTCTFRCLYTKKVIEDTLICTASGKVQYPSCARYALELDYHQNLTRKELTGHTSDLLCLWGVDVLFSAAWYPHSGLLGCSACFESSSMKSWPLST